ncbi:MAG: SRPBCC family protein [Mycobacteriales bacterium]
MNEIHGTASTEVAADPASVFALLTDVDRLPTWNQAIEAVVSRPGVLDAGSEWHVTMHPPRMPSWGSISTVIEHDPRARRFSYRTRNADGNPSWTEWRWSLEPTGAGTVVNVSWDVYLKTPDRKYFAGPLRKRQLAREVPQSLVALKAALA